MKKPLVIGLVLAPLVLLVAYTQLTLFVIPRIGVVPEGRIVVILRLNKTNFVDSPDGMCERIQGGVSLLCRMVTMGAVLEKSTILVRLPYSHWLYLVSTGGKTYER